MRETKRGFAALLLLSGGFVNIYMQSINVFSGRHMSAQA